MYSQAHAASGRTTMRILRSVFVASSRTGVVRLPSPDPLVVKNRPGYATMWIAIAV